MAKWILRRAGKDSAPIDHVKMTELAKLGRLMPTDLIALEGSDNWVPGDKFSDYLGRVKPPSEMTILDVPVEPLYAVQALSELGDVEANAPTPPAIRFQNQKKQKEIATRHVLKLAALAIGLLGGLVAILWLGTYTYHRHQAAQYAAVSRDQLKEIALALSQYAQTHGDVYPHSLGLLLKEKQLAPRQLLHPATRHVTPVTFDPDELAKWADTASDYGYLASGAPFSELDPRTLVVYERREEAGGAPILALTAGGTIVAVEASEADELIRASRSHAWSKAQAAKLHPAAQSKATAPPGSPDK